MTFPNMFYLTAGGTSLCLLLCRVLYSWIGVEHERRMMEEKEKVIKELEQKSRQEGVFTIQEKEDFSSPTQRSQKSGLSALQFLNASGVTRF